MSIKTHTTLPCWRSLLFIPAHVQRFIGSASKRNADAIILDLEDSVPSEVKPHARQQLAEHIKFLNGENLDVLVRINRDLINAITDLQVAITPYTKAILIPKVMGAEHICLLDETVSILEHTAGIADGTIKFIAMIETIEGLNNINTIAQSSARMIGLALGTEDLSLDGGFEPIPDNLFYPAQQLIYAARLANISAYGFPGSIADYSDINVFTQYQVKAKSMGFNGALCIHPSQVGPVNHTYTASAEELQQAKRIISAYQDATNNQLGAVELDGKMIDAPVVERAMRLVDLYDKTEK
jgi:citrate lyase subunit beta/citryl-CoA lyase